MGKQRFKHLLILALVFFFASHSLIVHGRQKLKLGKYVIKNIQQEEPLNIATKMEPTDAEKCKDFLLTESQIRKFLYTAEIINGNQWHYEYYGGICEVTADVVSRNKVYKLRINKGLFGWLTMGSEKIILGCKEKGPWDEEVGAVDHEQCF